MTQLQPGENLGPYQILGQVGKGGMATVYKAFHAPMNRFVAIKVLPQQLTESPEFVARFQQEAQTIANLQHPQILPVFDYGDSNGRMYMVMRYLDTGTLKERIESRPLSLKDIDHLFVQLLDALGYAHAQNIIHRDLKPSNALVDSQDNLFLTDFGVAKVLERQTKFTETGALMGTPDYMSPEQAQGLQVDQRSDIYSLGIILYEMVTGRVPYEAETPLAVILKHISDPLPPPSAVKPGIAPGIERVILKALSKRPEDRFTTCAEFRTAWREALAQAESGSIPVRDTFAAPPKAETLRESAPMPATPPHSGNDTWLVVGCLGVLAVVACALLIGGVWAFSSLGSTVSQALATQNAITPEVATAVALDGPGAEATATALISEAATLPPALPSTATAAPAIETFNVSNNPRESEYPQVLVDSSSTVHVIWADKSLRPEGDMFYRQQNSDGEWSEAETLSSGQGTLVGGATQWLRQPDGAWCALWYSLNWQLRCLQDGKFTAAERVSTNVSWGDDPAFAFAPDGSLKIAYAQFSKVYFDEEQLSEGFDTVHDLRMVIDSDGNPHVVWLEHFGSDFVVRYRHSADSGQTWGEIETLTDADTHANLGSPLDLAADSQGRVHFVWQSSPFLSNDGMSFYRRWSADGGWEPAVELPGGKPLTEMTLTIDGEGLAHVAAAGAVGTQRGIMYFQQLASGEWNPAWLVFVDPGASSSSRYPQLFVDASGGRYVVWQSAENPPDVLYAKLP